MKYASMIARFSNSLWASTSGTMEAVYRMISGNGFKADMDDVEGKERPISYAAGSVRVIQVYGIIGRNLSLMETLCGGMDVNTIRAEAEKAVNDTNVKTIIFDFDSPGGVVHGGPELAKYIRSIEKETIAYTGGQCASMAYYLASACDVVLCSPSSSVGSVGVYMAWIDQSKRMDREGDELVIIKAGTEKAAFLDGQLNDVARETLLESANSIYEGFKAFIRAEGRTVDDKYLQGMAYNGDKALEIGLVDGLYDTIEQLIMEVVQ